MSKINFDVLNLSTRIDGIPRVNDIMKMQVIDSNLLPKPVSYRDIDLAVTSFVTNNFNVQSISEEIKTFFFVPQRMSEFTKTWEMLDENKNVLPNFKIVTKENNPKPGTLQGGKFNIPGEPYFDIGTFNKWDGNKNITVTCKVKQPYCVDIIYNVKFITNRLSLLNEMNNCVINEFKSKQSYVVVNGHYMSMVLEDIGDESEYDLDQRKILVQNFQIKLTGYIINEEDIIFEENIVRKIVDAHIDVNNNINSMLFDDGLHIDFPVNSKSFIVFKSNDWYNIVNVITDDNIMSYNIKINNRNVNGGFEIDKYDKISITIKRNDVSKPTKIILKTN